MSEMYLGISARFTFKDRPKDHRGVTSEQWRFGTDGPRSFSGIGQSLLITTLEYYLRLNDAETLNAELDKLRTWLAGITIDEETPDDPSTP